MLMRKLSAEFVGTFLLVFLAVGAAVSGIGGLSGPAAGSGVLGVAVGFGLVLMGLAYAIGPTSGCHVNPAVTLAFVLSKRQEAKEGLFYMVAQFLGAAVGGALLKFMVTTGHIVDHTGALGTNNYGGSGPTVAGAFIVEALLTAAFVGVILLVTDTKAAAGFAGLAIGGTLAAVHLVGIPITGTSVNPARSLGPALFAGGESLSQVWLFLVAPYVGGALAVLFFKFTRPFGAELGDVGTEAMERQDFAAELAGAVQASEDGQHKAGTDG
jgi:aquaporin Z